MKSLKEFLTQRITKQNEKPTHTNMNSENGLKLASFTISDEDYPGFIKIYEQALLAGAKVGIVEIPHDIAPVYIDADIIQSSNKREYNLEHLVETVNEYRNRIVDIYEIEDENQLNAYIFEKDAPTSNGQGKYKDGYHIVFPKVYVTKTDQKMLNALSKNKAVDTGVSKYLMHGSCKKGRKPYKLTRILDYENNLIANNVSLSQTLELISLRQGQIISTPKLVNNIEEEDGESKGDIDTSISSSTGGTAQPELKKNDIRAILAMLSIDKCDDYNFWIYTGMALKRMSESYLNLWVEFSRRSDKFEEGKTDKLCQRKWRGFVRDKGYTIGTLIHWAKQDSPNEFGKFCQHRMTERLSQSNNAENHWDVACLLWEKYNDSFVCVCPRSEKWWHYNKDRHSWEYIDNGWALAMKIPQELYVDFLAASQFYNSKAMSPDCTDMERSHWTAKSQECLKICDKRLKDQGFVSKVMKMAANLFFKRKEEFLEKLDENKFLLGVENGVIDLGEDDPEPGKKHQIILRPGVPDDFITKSCKIPYRSYEEFIKDKDPRVEELTQFRESIFINAELRDYFEGVFASSLDGYLRTEKLYILIGGGSNGKSKYMTVLENAFGDYTTTVSSTLLTGKRPSSSSATPDLMALKGVRLVTAQEPDKTDSWNMSEVKKFTGGDTVTARPLYGEIQNFKLQSTITVACNCAPKMGNNFTQGDLRRMEYIPFETTFKEFPQKEDERKIDPYLGIKMKEWHEVTLSYMLHRYCRVREEGLKVPDRVLEENRVNERNNNFMQQWTEEFVVEDEDGVVKMKDAYTRFKIWLKDIDKDSVVPTRKDFLDYLTKYFDKKPANNKWKGYSLKNEDEDEDGGGGIY